MPPSIPNQMRTVVLEAYHEDLSEAIAGLKVQERPVPKPHRGQVLVKIEAAPCNPSDLMLLAGKYGTSKTLPAAPGWEGAGTVVASGGGLVARWLKGKRVACGLAGEGDGTWAEFAVASVTECIPLRGDVDIEQAASLIVNPMTAMGLLETARRGKHRAAVHTAGASQLGRMLIAMARDADYPLINVVRREPQVQLLRSLGAEHVLNMTTEDFPEQLRERCAALSATIAFEAVAGDTTGVVLNALPAGSTVYVYGALSEQACGAINPVGLIFHRKTVTGFYLADWIKQRGLWGTLRAARRVQKLLAAGRIETKVQRRLALDDAREGLQHYVDHMTDGKVLLKPHEHGDG